MLNIISHHESESENHSTALEWLEQHRQIITSVGKDVEILKPLVIDGGYVKWCTGFV